MQVRSRIQGRQNHNLSTSDSPSDEGRESEGGHCSCHPRSCKPVLKPKDLECYDGSVNIQAFHRFMTGMTQYLEDYGVPSSHHAVTVSWFLKDKAWTYYVSSVL